MEAKGAGKDHGGRSGTHGYCLSVSLVKLVLWKVVALLPPFTVGKDYGTGTRNAVERGI